MNPRIFYFSSTGNSLAVAQNVAAGIGGETASIPSLLTAGTIDPSPDVLGFVFPAHYANLGEQGVPSLVERFVENLGDLQGKYLFAICTHSGLPVDTLEHFEQRIRTRGGTLSAGLEIQMTVPHRTGDKIRHALWGRALPQDSGPGAKDRTQLLSARKKLQEFLLSLQKRTLVPIKRRSAFNKMVTAWFFRLQKTAALARYQELAGSPKQELKELILEADRSFTVGERCTSCGLCKRVCPANNIVMKQGKPHWGHHCSTCYACFQWCPSKAISGKVVEYERRHHHPEIRAKDISG